MFIGNNDALGTGDLTYNGGSIVASNNGLSLNNNININSNLALSGSNDITLNGIINDGAGNFAITKSGSSNITLSGNNTFDGGITINSGTLTLGHNNAAGLGDITFNGGSIAAGVAGIEIGSGIILNTDIGLAGSVDFTVSGDITGLYGVSKSGNSTVTLAGTNSYGGTTSITGGTLSISDAQALGNTAGGTVISNGGTLNIANTNLGNEVINLNGGNITTTGNSSLAGTIALNNTGNVISAANTLTINGDINGSGDLNLNGAGTINVAGNIGNTTAINSLTTSANTSFAGTVTTTGDQVYNSAITLNAGASNFTSNSGAISFNDTLDGAVDLTLNSSGATSLEDVVGATTELNSLSITANNININGGNVNTANDQTYSGLVTLGGTTTLTTSSAGNVAIALNNGLAGGQSLTLAGATTANQTFTLAGNLNADVITINGGTGGNNTLALNTGSAQVFEINATDSGNVSGISNVNGFNFNNIDNLSGGSANDSFILSGGGNLSGNINGNGGTNTLTGDSTANTWNITGSNTGNVTGLGGNFNNIQNLTGGNNTDIFVFADGAIVSGMIDGGNSPTPAQRNTLDFTAYTTSVTVNLINNIRSGESRNTANGWMSGHSNINYLMADRSLNNIINLQSGTTGTPVTVTNATMKRGYIGNPTFFDGFNVNIPATPIPDASDTNTTNNSVAQIVEQPQNNVEANEPVYETPAWVASEQTTTQSINDISQQTQSLFEEELESADVNPYCFIGS